MPPHVMTAVESHSEVGEIDFYIQMHTKTLFYSSLKRKCFETLNVIFLEESFIIFPIQRKGERERGYVTHFGRETFSISV